MQRRSVLYPAAHNNESPDLTERSASFSASTLHNPYRRDPELDSVCPRLHSSLGSDPRVKSNASHFERDDRGEIIMVETIQIMTAVIE